MRAWGIGLLATGLVGCALLAMVSASGVFLQDPDLGTPLLGSAVLVALAAALLGGALLAGARPGGWARVGRVVAASVGLLLFGGAILMAADATPREHDVHPLKSWGVPLAAVAAVALVRVALPPRAAAWLAGGLLVALGVAAIAGGDHFWVGVIALLAGATVVLAAPRAAGSEADGAP